MLDSVPALTHEVPTATVLRDRLLGSFASFCCFFQDETHYDPIHAAICQTIQTELETRLSETVNYLREVKQAMAEGRPMDDTLECPVFEITLTMPRGSLKTTYLTKYFPVWLTLKAYYRIWPNPEWSELLDDSLRTLIVNNTHTNAKGRLRDIKGLVAHDHFKKLFSEVLPTSQEQTSSEYYTLNLHRSWPEATFEAAGTNTQKISMHYNLIIQDDTVAPEQSDLDKGMALPSPERVNQGIGYHQLTPSLLINSGIRIRLVVSTRWGEDDLLAHIWKTERNFIRIDVPAIVCDDVSDWQSGRTVFSTLLTKATLASYEAKMSLYLFACLYLNRPQDLSLRRFQPAWFQKILRREVPTGGFCTLAVDPAISKSNDACPTAITVVKHFLEAGRRPIQYWLEDRVDKYEPSETVEITLDLAQELAKAGEDVRFIIIETVAFQEALKYDFYNAMNRRGQHYPIVELKNARTKKEIRIEGYLQPLFKQGKIFWCSDTLTKDGQSDTLLCERQLSAFPTGTFIDVPDSFSFHKEAYVRERGLVPTEESPEGKQPESWEDIIKEIQSRRSQGIGGYPRMGLVREPGVRDLPRLARMLATRTQN